MKPGSLLTSLRVRTRPATPAGLPLQLLVLSLTRTVLNTNHRMIYPFLPTIARGLGVDVESVALMVTARSGLGLFSPAVGALADVRGRRAALLLALLAFAGAMALVALWPTYPALFAAVLLAGIAKLLFDPALHAYLGDRVDYARRGLAVAVAEMSWSAAFLLGMPVVGWLISRADRWHAPFPWLAGLGLLGALAIWRTLPADAPLAVERPSFVQGARTVLAHRSALAGLAIGLLISAANEVVGIVFGVWMEDAFAMQVAALGAASAVIGVAELGGEGLVAGIADRVGKRRAVAGGLALNALASVLLPVIGITQGGALVGLFLYYITFEFALVSSIPLMTELVPAARATLMAGNVAAISVGRMVGALAGPALYAAGMLANGTAAAALNLLALVLLLAFVKPGDGSNRRL